MAIQWSPSYISPQISNFPSSHNAQLPSQCSFQVWWFKHIKTKSVPLMSRALETVTQVKHGEPLYIKKISITGTTMEQVCVAIFSLRYDPECYHNNTALYAMPKSPAWAVNPSTDTYFLYELLHTLHNMFVEFDGFDGTLRHLCHFGLGDWRLDLIQWGQLKMNSPQ